MNKYDFDFIRVEDVLYDVLGIDNPTDIEGLKLQIKDTLGALSAAIDRKNSQVSPNHPEKAEVQKAALQRELDEIKDDTNLDRVLRKCITIRYLALLNLHQKYRLTDTPEEKQEKKNKRDEINAVSNMIRSVPSVLDFIYQRNNIMRYTDSENRIIQFNRTPSRRRERVVTRYPVNRLNIRFIGNPQGTNGLYKSVLEEAGIYIYKFGNVTFSRFPNEMGKYTQEVTSKNLIGVIKKDEFGALRKYSVIMNDIPMDMPPEFCRDVLFSDMLLRNAENNLGFLGSPERFEEDDVYGYTIGFNEIGIQDFLSAIYFENEPSEVLVNSNFSRVQSIADAFNVMQEKMENAVRELLEQDEPNGENR